MKRHVDTFVEVIFIGTQFWDSRAQIILLIFKQDQWYFKIILNLINVK